MQSLERYTRQMILPGFGTEAQRKLRDASVLIVGIGGLGCPALQYLVGAGVGTIGVMDPDKISMSNLHRQLLFSEKDIGQYKVEIAAEKMRMQNDDVVIKPFPFSLTNLNALDIFAEYSIIIDGTDQFSAKYLINDACMILGKPFVYGAVSRYEGQISFFHPSIENERAFQYRDLFPTPPRAHEIPGCEEAGVLGVLPGIIGTMQAAEVIKWITGIGTTLHGKLLNYDLLQARSYEILLSKQADNIPLDKESFIRMSYDFNYDDADDISEIGIVAFRELMQQGNVFVLDVRERHEYPRIDFADEQIPMSELKGAIASLPEKEICIICHQGIRSIYAAQLIRAQRGLTVHSVKGGITAYFNQYAS